MKQIKKLILILILVTTLLPINTFAMQLFVQIPTGNITLDVETTDTIAAVKEKIYDKTLIPSHQQSLIYQEKVLEEWRILADYNIQLEATINLVLKQNKILIKKSEFGTATTTETSSFNEIVEITITPKEGYQIDKITVYKEDDEKTTIEVTDNKFTMPDFNVYIEVTYLETSLEPNPNTSDNIIGVLITTIIASICLVITILLIKKQRSYTKTKK